MGKMNQRGLSGALWGLMLATPIVLGGVAGAQVNTPPGGSPTPGMNTADLDSRFVSLARPGFPVSVPVGRRVKIFASFLPAGTDYRYKVDAGPWVTLERPRWPEGAPSTIPACLAARQKFETLLATRAAFLEAPLVAFKERGPDERCPAELERRLDEQVGRFSPLLFETPPDFDWKVPHSLQVVSYIPETGQTLFGVVWPILGEGAPPIVTPTPRPPILVPVGTPATEEEWIVRSITDAILEFAPDRAPRQKGATATRTEGSRYRVEPGSSGLAAMVVDTAPFVWDPLAYVELARASVGVSSRVPPDARRTNALRLLQTPSDENLHTLNMELGSRLADYPQDATAHETSALLLGVMGLRYSEGRFTDLRGVLNRMTAHLALAHALEREGLGVEGGLARVVLDLLVHRERPAAARLVQVRATPLEEMPPWDRALWMRATNDWRRVEKLEKATLLERLEYFRALEATRGKDFTAARMANATPENIPDWMRLMVCGRTCLSVELGNAMRDQPIDQELQAGAAIGRRLEMTGDDWWQKATPPSTQRRRPIPDELWRQSVERAVANALAAQHERMTSLGDDQGLGAFDQRITSAFPHSAVVATLPLVLKSLGGQSSGEGQFPAACRIGGQEAAVAPWRVPARTWAALDSLCEDGSVPDPDKWFDNWLPRGTLYDLRGRLRSQFHLGLATKADWTQLSALTKYDDQVVAWSAGRRQSDPESRDFEPYRAEFGYNVQLLRDWRSGEGAHPKEALEPARLACKLDTEECFELIDVLRANDRTDEAFSVGTRAFKTAGGTVSASHFAYWMVDEYVRRGQLSAALALAEEVAETGSYMGLLTKARLVERQGRYGEAAQLWRSIDQRYGAQTEAAMRIRRIARNPSTPRAEVQKALLSLPEDEADDASITDSWLQDRGIVFRRDAAAMGLRLGDTIVEVNGWKTASSAQVRVALSFTDESVARLVVVRQTPTGPASQVERITLAGLLDVVSYAPIR